ncbi:hypothetical protein [Haloechinothrix salitolerans]|uniref:Uncharacterized protein n=1 Tax=Haloechinothrix salitolerans TaxID=926830 RepID=A0ABW2C186_9PSEU
MKTTSNTRREWAWLPDSRPGTVAVGLAALVLCGTILLAVGFALGMEPAETFTDNWLLTVAGAVILAGGLAAAVVGAVALVRRDRSWAVVVATTVGVLVTALLLQQLAEGLG